MKKRPKILVAHKKSRYQQIIEFIEESRNRKDHDDSLITTDLTFSEIKDLDPKTYDALRRPHEIHQQSLFQVVETLQQYSCDFDVQFRGDVEKVGDVDFVITVGGDGTVLDLSHKVCNQPLLGINSNPSSSVGYFCAGTVDELPSLLDEIFSSKIVPLSLLRFSVELNGQPIDLPILNDILVANENPAAVSNYAIQVGEHEPEFQKSSGIWISTPAGSTAAIHSAGGYIQPLASRYIQYLVREPCPQPARSYRHLKGIRPLDGEFTITSRMRTGRLYLDGPHNSIPFRFGDILKLTKTHDFKIYRLSDCKRE